MEGYLIEGGRRLSGAVRLHGAKNGVLPLLAACVCCADVCELHNCPRLTDVDAAAAILRQLGCIVERRGDTLTVDARSVTGCEIPRRLMRDLRSSVLFLGALLTRCGEADLTPPGGCALGKRPIDLHLYAAEWLGARCEFAGDRVFCRMERPRGAALEFHCPSVGATENAMLIALGCPGRTTLHGAAREPEVVELARFLRAMGARIAGEGSGTIGIEGGAPLHGVSFTVMPDRIEAATYLCAAAACGGDVFLHGGQRRCLEAVLAALGRSGCQIAEEADGLRLKAPERLRGAGEIVTAPYPGFPTDAQAPLMAALLRAEGETAFEETIFEDRLRHVPELRRLGADIRTEGRRALVRGVDTLRGAELRATDLRCGAALIVAALQAEGESLVDGRRYVERGYEALPETLQSLGARMEQITA